MKKWKLVMPACVGLAMMLSGGSYAHNQYNNYHNIDLTKEAVELQDTIHKLIEDGSNKNITEVDRGVLKTQDRLLDMYTNSYVNGGTSESTLLDLINRIRHNIGDMTNTNQPNTCQGKQPYECASIN